MTPRRLNAGSNPVTPKVDLAFHPSGVDFAAGEKAPEQTDKPGTEAPKSREKEPEPKFEEKPTSGERTPNDVFLDCCKRRKDVPKSCYTYCAYEKYNWKTVRLYFSTTLHVQMSQLYGVYQKQDYPRSALKGYGMCVHQQLDHVDCCKEKRFKGKCLDLCHENMADRKVDLLSYGIKAKNTFL